LKYWFAMIDFMNNTECAALEAADTLLDITISLHGTDPNIIIRWVDVNQIRYRNLKAVRKLKLLMEIL